MNNIKVSVIIPIYNPGELLRKCIDSVLNQTLNEIEVLCIDDGSTDDSKEIIMEYCQRDSRFKLISQENSGSGMARNNGISLSKGEYIVFLDADDWIEPNMCEALYNHAKNLDVDLVLFDNVWHREDGSVSEFVHFSSDEFNQDFNNNIFDYHSVNDKIFDGYFGVIWTKFYKSSFIKENNIEFPKHKLYNDIEFHIKSIILAKTISYCPKVLYHYQKAGHNSLQTSYRGKKEAMVFYDVMVSIRDFLIGEKLMGEFRSDFLNYSFDNFILKLNEITKEYKNVYFLKIKSFFESLLLSPKDFDKLNFKYLPYYIHMINSKDFNEFKVRMSYFDKELINPQRYIDVEDSKGIFENGHYLNNRKDYSDLNLFRSDSSQNNVVDDNFCLKILPLSVNLLSIITVLYLNFNFFEK